MIQPTDAVLRTDDELPDRGPYIHQHMGIYLSSCSLSKAKQTELSTQTNTTDEYDRDRLCMQQHFDIYKLTQSV